MSSKDIKKIYDSFAESGDLKTMFPSMTGDWAKDEKDFTRQYIRNEDSLEIFSLDDEEDYDEFY